MKRTPLILGAIPLTILAGASIGTAVATDPIGRAGDPLEQIPRHQVESRSAAEAQAMLAPQNQYPLETPDGVVAVAELAYHGRLRNRMREQPVYGAASEAEAFGVDEQARFALVEQTALHTAEQLQAPPDGFVPLEDGVFENVAPAPSPPPAQRTRFAQRDVELQGKARMIDVEAQLDATSR